MQEAQKQEKIKAIPSNRLQYFPIMMFATIMGLGGLTLVYEKMSAIFSFPSYISTALLAISTVSFFIALITYFTGTSQDYRNCQF